MGWLVTISVIEIVALVAVLAAFLIALTRRLRGTVENLARISFGVRAVESQVAGLTPTVEEVNRRLATLARSASDAADAAEREGSG